MCPMDASYQAVKAPIAFMEELTVIIRKNIEKPYFAVGAFLLMADICEKIRDGLVPFDALSKILAQALRAVEVNS